MRQVFDIPGGVHPAENKQQSLTQSIADPGVPPQLIHPLSQHIGAPAVAVVNVGDRVLKGQKIADAKGFVSVPVHASSSGIVTAIEERAIPHQSGMAAMCIVVETDGEDAAVAFNGTDDYTALEPTALLDIIRDAGISGMGGAGFPAAVKLVPRSPIDTLIINGTECEPYITADDALMRERAADIIAGVKILQHLIKPTDSTLIGIEDNKPEAIAAMQLAAAGSHIEIVSFPTKYPSGGEKQLIQILTGREVQSGGLPSDIGVVCQNIGTANAVFRAVTLGEPLISRVTTVTGDAIAKKGNYDVRLGTPVRWLLGHCGIDRDTSSRLVMGGPMMGFTLQDDNVPVVKTTNCLMAPTAKELPPPQPAQACIRCGMCAEACPVSLLPQQMYWFARAQEHEKLETHNLFDCIECGACSFACPSHIPLVQYYRAAKGEIIHHRKEKVKAEQSKARFEARQERLEREDAEKEAKRKARKEAAKARAAQAAESGGEDAVAAAISRAKAKQTETTTAAAVPTAEPAAPAIDSADPAQQAIAKALAARAASADLSPAEKAEKAVISLQARVEKSRNKLAAARDSGDENAEILATALEKMEAKLVTAQAELESTRAGVNS